MIAVAAIAWLASLQLAPTTHGIGSTLSGHALADLIGSGALGHTIPSWLGPAWYAIPIAGALLLITLGSCPRWASRARFAIAIAGATPALTFTALLTKLNLDRFGPGSWSAVTGSGLALGAVIVEIVVDRRGWSGVL